MNHFLKPIGHCLTTAVMTSAMLRIYALPVEAAPLPDTPIDTQTTSAEFEAASETAVSATDLVPTQIAPPEVIAPVPTIVAPAIAPAEPILANPVNSAQAASVSPVEPASETIEAPEKAAEELETAETPAGALGSSASKKPSTAESTLLVPIEPKATTASPQKAAEPNTRTIAGMRQVIEKRLATLVDQDKASRTAQWQQMLIQTALQYAWTHQFSQARQVAQHPALPIGLQTDLLGKIAAIELQSSSIAQQLPLKLTPSGVVAQPGTVAAGQIPPSYLGGAGLPSYAGITLGNQCPAIGSVPMAKAVKSSSPAAKPATGVKKGIPTFVPSLSQNLATRLVQLSQAAEAEQNLQASSVKTAQHPLVIPQLFVGVAQQTATTPVAQLTPLVATPDSVSTAQSQSTETSSAVSTVAAVSTIAAGTPANSASVPRLKPMRAASIETTESMAAASSTGSLPLTASASSVGAIPELASVPVSSTLEQLLNSTFYSFQQVGIPFAQFVSEPFNFGWWHDAPESTAPTQPELQPNSVAIGASLPLQPALPQTPQWRDARKLAIPSLPKLPVSSKAVKGQTQDISTLLATSCANAQLGHYELGDYVVHPTTAKQQGWGNLMFPLPISAAITSAFGWRIHPISGSLSFHAGIDIGAPMGTPVMAAQSGKVVAADYMGGYGLAVVVENDQNRQRNLYGHLSGVAVQPGVQIAEGAILGWVGSTGNSTGPHLHLEAQVRTEAGWTAIDPLAAAALTLAKGE